MEDDRLITLKTLIEREDELKNELKTKYTNNEIRKELNAVHYILGFYIRRLSNYDTPGNLGLMSEVVDIRENLEKRRRENPYF